MSLETFSTVLSTSTHTFAHPLPAELLMASEGKLQTFYAPFDHINTSARIVICGITPGMQQARLALNEARQQLREGASIEKAKQTAKETGSFAGTLGNNLVRMLDHVGVHTLLQIDSCARLFSSHRHLLHSTSALRYPVFVDSKDYNGSPAILSRASLRHQVDTYLAEEIRALGPQCLYVPLGPKVTEVFQHLQAKGLLKNEQLLDGLPHPSGANAERISYFLGGKPREKLSKQTNPASLDAAKARLLAKLPFSVTHLLVKDARESLLSSQLSTGYFSCRSHRLGWGGNTTFSHAGLAQLTAQQSKRPGLQIRFFLLILGNAFF